MMRLTIPLLLVAITLMTEVANAFVSTHALSSKKRNTMFLSVVKNTSISRQEFVAASIAGTVLTVLSPPVHARGRATLEQAYDRYSPRIITGGKFYNTELKRAVERADWATIKEATTEPPKRRKSDASKIDGGISERAALAGGFSNARVVSALDLWASSFSDNAISAKTKKMRVQAEEVRNVVDSLNSLSKVGLGEEKSGGGILGFGGKAKSKAELAKEARELYTQGGNSWNEYINVSNEGLPVQMQKLPFL